MLASMSRVRLQEGDAEAVPQEVQWAGMDTEAVSAPGTELPAPIIWDDAGAAAPPVPMADGGSDTIEWTFYGLVMLAVVVATAVL